jgi:MFS family permease
MMLFFQGFIVRRLLPKIGEKPMAVGGGILLALGLAAIAITAGVAVDPTATVDAKMALIKLFAVAPISVAGFSALNPSLQSLISLNTPADEQGEVLGVAQSLSALARIVGPLVGIPLLKQVGVQAPYWVATVGMLVAAGFVAAIRQPAHGEVGATPPSTEY